MIKYKLNLLFEALLLSPYVIGVGTVAELKD